MSAKFAPGDIVEVIDAADRAPGFEFIRNGLRGTVVSYWGRGGTVSNPATEFWLCEFSGFPVISAAHCIRKVPPDPGRELVEWDWRELITKQPECV